MPRSTRKLRSKRPLFFENSSKRVEYPRSNPEKVSPSRNLERMEKIHEFTTKLSPEKPMTQRELERLESKLSSEEKDKAVEEKDRAVEEKARAVEEKARGLEAKCRGKKEKEECRQGFEFMIPSTPGKLDFQFVKIFPICQHVLFVTCPFCQHVHFVCCADNL